MKKELPKEKNFVIALAPLLLSGCVVGIFYTGSHMDVIEIIKEGCSLAYVLCIISFFIYWLSTLDIWCHHALANSPNSRPERPRVGRLWRAQQRLIRLARGKPGLVVVGGENERHALVDRLRKLI